MILQCKRCILTMALMAGSMVVAAAELPEGTVIEKANYDQVKNDTFEGKTIASMIPEKVEWQILNWGLTIKLRKSEPIHLGPELIAATEKYAGDVQYDAEKNEVTGYKAGLPFPNADPSDPNYAAKLVWNFYYASPVGQVLNYDFTYLLIDGNKGLERRQEWVLYRYMMKNRLSGENAPVDGDGSLMSKTLLFATYPQDIRGIGTYTARHDGPQFEDSWVYLKSARRTRRLPGGAWMDPIGGTDQLQDDLEVFNARPSWYKSFKYIGKHWILAVAHQTSPRDISKEGTLEEWPTFNLKDAPYWNTVDGWEPRQVHVIEAITPDSHPYSKKIIYMDVDYPRIYMGEAYDRKGDFWKWFITSGRPVMGEDGVQTYISGQGATIDFKRKHATLFVNSPDSKTNSPWSSNDVSLGKLEAAGQ